MHYKLTAIAFDTDCVELMHSPSNDPAAIADKTLPVGHWLGVGLGLGLGLGFGLGGGALVRVRVRVRARVRGWGGVGEGEGERLGWRWG